jgi:hypothetical protein
MYGICIPYTNICTHFPAILTLMCTGRERERDFEFAVLLCLRYVRYRILAMLFFRASQKRCTIFFMREMDIQLRTLLDSIILFITWMFLIVVNPILLFVEPLDRVSRKVYLSVKYDGKGGRNVVDLKDIF